MSEDTLEIRWNGGGGIGDPLSRPLQAVLEDVNNHLVSVSAADEVYGVVFNNGELDETASLKNRTEIRNSTSANIHEQPVNTPRISTHESGETFCTACENSISKDPSTNWKYSARVRKVSLSNIYPDYERTDVFVTEFTCPHCSFLLDSELTYHDDPPLLDFLGVIHNA